MEDAAEKTHSLPGQHLQSTKQMCSLDFLWLSLVEDKESGLLSVRWSGGRVFGESLFYRYLRSQFYDLTLNLECRRGHRAGLG